MTYRTPHGERRTYIAGCRCESCGRAHSRYCKEARLRVSRGQRARVPAALVLARMDELNANGFTDNAVAHAAGLSSSTLARLRTGRHATAATSTLAAINAVTETTSGVVPGDLTRLRVRALQRAGWRIDHIQDAAGVRLQDGKWRYTRGVSAKCAHGVREAYRRLECRDGGNRLVAGMARAAGYPLPAEWDDPGTLAWPADVVPWTPPARLDRQRGRPLEWDAARWGDVDHLRSFGIPDDQIAARFGVRPGTLDKAERRAGRRASEAPAA